MNELIHNILDKRGAPVLIVIFILLFIAETVTALRKRTRPRTKRIIMNSLVSVPGLLTLRFILLPAMVATALLNEEWRFGLMHLFNGDVFIEGAVTFLLLDYLNYIWHLLNHRLTFLWRFHVVHHTDHDLDVTTAIRFHAGELFTSVVFRGAAVLIIGASPVMVLVYEIFFEAATQFHHSNWRLPLTFERLLSKIIVTPRMHGIHHSVIRNETDSNYSVIFSWWDRLHKTIRLDKHQHEIVIGAPGYEKTDLTVWELLRLPFTKIRR